MKTTIQFLLGVGIGLILSLTACRETTNTSTLLEYRKLEGRTMGTTYHITYSDSLPRNVKTGIDSLLLAINLEVSTYIDTSFISRFNQERLGLSLPDGHFKTNYELAGEVYRTTQGAFDPTVMPLVNYWGFGYTGKEPVKEVDSLRIDSLLGFVGWDKVRTEAGKILKSRPGVQLDFSASAKGYGVDEVGRYLERLGVRNYMVEIGGEVRARGKNPVGKAWSIGINTPSPEASPTDFKAIVELVDKSLATSGNYRNFYEVDGRKYAHTINPKTGFPELTDLLSASVFADDCATADAFATAFMVMGLDRSLALADSLEGIEAYFIYGSVEGTMQFRFTPGMQAWIKEVTPLN